MHALKKINPSLLIFRPKKWNKEKYEWTKKPTSSEICSGLFRWYFKSASSKNMILVGNNPDEQATHFFHKNGIFGIVSKWMSDQSKSSKKYLWTTALFFRETACVGYWADEQYLSAVGTLWITSHASVSWVFDSRHGHIRFQRTRGPVGRWHRTVGILPHRRTLYGGGSPPGSIYCATQDPIQKPQT